MPYPMVRLASRKHDILKGVIGFSLPMEPEINPARYPSRAILPIGISAKSRLITYRITGFRPFLVIQQLPLVYG